MTYLPFNLKQYLPDIINVNVFVIQSTYDVVVNLNCY